jgi:hypothetical protein
MKTIVLATAMTLAYLSDSLAQWTKINAISSRAIVALVNNGDTILAASGTNLIYRNLDNEVIWTPITVSSGNIAITTLDIIDNIIYVGTAANGIFYSSNGGLTWMNKGGKLLTISGIEKRGNDLYAATLGEGVFIFYQETDKWISFNNSLPTYSVNVFTMLSTPRSLLIGAGANGTFYWYDYNNSQWNEESYYGLLRPGLIIYKLITVSNTIFAVNGNRIIRSDDDGIIWTDDKTGSHDGTSRNIYSGADNIYTITNMLNGGTCIQERNKSSSTGSSWASTEEFLPYGFSYDILEFRNKLFLARADGLYMKDGILGIDNSGPDKSEVKIYPNPSDGKLINISSDNQINKLTIFNLLGKIEYSEIVNNNRLIIQPNLDKGVYFLKLNMANDGNKVKKIIVE